MDYVEMVGYDILSNRWLDHFWRDLLVSFLRMPEVVETLHEQKDRDAEQTCALNASSGWLLE